MKLLALLLGLAGLALLCPASVGRGSGGLIAVAVVLMALGALIFMAAGRAAQRNTEERRHQELIEATRQRDRQR